jgi:hypothetical protein
VSEGCFAKPWRAVKEAVAERFTALFGCADKDVEAFVQMFLAQKFCQSERAQRRLEVFIGLCPGRFYEGLGHGVALFYENSSRKTISNAIPITVKNCAEIEVWDFSLIVGFGIWRKQKA